MEPSPKRAQAVANPLSNFASSVNSIVGTRPQTAPNRQHSALVNFLNGEKLLIRDCTSIDCTVDLDEHVSTAGKAITTNYRLVIIPNDTHFSRYYQIRSDFLEFPLQIVKSCERILGNRNQTIIMLQTKDFRSAKITFNYPSEIYTMLYSHIFQPIFRNLFAFMHYLDPVAQTNAFVFDGFSHYTRFGISSETEPYCLFDNTSGQVCETYPEAIAVIAGFNIKRLQKMRSKRIKDRIPVLTFLYKSGASLWRASVPKSGYALSKGSEDEHYVKAILAASPAKKVRVFDCRPFQGGMFSSKPKSRFETKPIVPGVEITQTYMDSIETISGVYRNIIGGEDARFYSSLDKSGWVKQIQNLFYATIIACEQIRSGASVIVTCLHGLDRTPQVMSLVQLCLDPYSRTIRGFANLIDREWVQFSHPFENRLGHREARETSETAPVFTQFLDCVYQLLFQFPTHFEFNETLLLEILHHQYTCRFGDFLVNNVGGRKQHNLPANTVSFWSYAMSLQERIVNPYFQAFQDEVIVPEVSPRRLSFWKTYFFQWQYDFYYSTPNIASSKEHKEVLMRTAAEGMSTYREQLTKKEEEILSLQREERKGAEFTD